MQPESDPPKHGEDGNDVPPEDAVPRGTKRKLEAMSALGGVLLAARDTIGATRMRDAAHERRLETAIGDIDCMRTRNVVRKLQADLKPRSLLPTDVTLRLLTFIDAAIAGDVEYIRNTSAGAFGVTPWSIMLTMCRMCASSAAELVEDAAANGVDTTEREVLSIAFKNPDLFKVDARRISLRHAGHEVANHGLTGTCVCSSMHDGHCCHRCH